MPAKRRKLYPQSSSQPNNLLHSFASFAKHAPSSSPGDIKKDAAAAAAAVIAPPSSSHQFTGGLERSKRKFSVDDEDEAPSFVTTSFQGNNGNPDRPIRPLPQARRSFLLQTPPKPVRPPSPLADTPTTKAANLFNQISLTRAPGAQWDSSPPPSTSHDADAPSTSHASANPFLDDDDDDDVRTPAEVTDLVTLHASLLTALNLHFAHHGTHTPADLRHLLPSIAISWGKRGVTLVDVQRALGVQNLQSARAPALSLANYGQGKICIEKSAAPGKKSGMARPINESLMLSQYTANLTRLWKKHAQTAGSDASSVSRFIHSLPLQSIPAGAPLESTSPTLTKGARRLAAMKKAPRQSSQRTLPFAYSDSSEPPSSPPPKASPPAAERLRRSALHRLPEIMHILNVLSTTGNAGQNRVGFSMGTVLSRLADSCRGEIGAEEARLCLDLLGGDIGGGWVRVVPGVGVKGGVVVVDRGRRPDEGVVGERIGVALASAGRDDGAHDDEDEEMW